MLLNQSGEFFGDILTPSRFEWWVAMARDLDDYAHPMGRLQFCSRPATLGVPPGQPWVLMANWGEKDPLAPPGPRALTIKGPYCFSFSLLVQARAGMGFGKMATRPASGALTILPGWPMR
jgi:hypothetical protein